MNVIATSAITICICCIVCALVNILMPSGTTQKMFNLILGAFLICAVLVPIKNAITDFNTNISSYEEIDHLSKDADAQLNDKVLKQTADNLVLTLNELFKSENLPVKNIEVSVNSNDSGGIYIKQINIYIDKQQEQSKSSYVSVAKENLKVTPNIIVE